VIWLVAALVGLIKVPGLVVASTATAAFIRGLVIFFFDVNEAKAQMGELAETSIVAKFEERGRHGHLKIIDEAAQLRDAVGVGLQVDEP
jgi:hypothetical protein